ncbi:FUSC family protein [Naasia lichenicola]|uniref:FUSC family protein n=1 Tax=Naasia lichenicola TaxID=2565933 RepID=A0A4S4FFH2_9MICO|nr:FUSC family protein [Naasia lichenicola]THG28738.1 FUSC family protein [Naasia lichenicola]
MRWANRFTTATRVPLLQVAKTGAAAIVAWFVASLLLPGVLPVFATVAALLVVQPSVNQSFGKALERSVGVIVGVLVALAIGIIFADQSWVVLAAVVASVFIAWALRLTPASSVQIPISAMLVLSIGAATPAYAAERIVETLIGAAIGLIINAAIVPPLAIGPARLAVSRVGRQSADILDRLAGELTSPTPAGSLATLLTDARALRQLRAAANDAVAQGRDSLTLNPRRSRFRDQLEQDIALFARLDPIVNQVIGMTRALRDHWDPSLLGEPVVAGIAEEIRRAAHDLRLLVRSEKQVARDGVEPPTVTGDLPALTAPLVILAPHPEHWILIGSLMEDLRRVREQIVGE